MVRGSVDSIANSLVFMCLMTQVIVVCFTTVCIAVSDFRTMFEWNSESKFVSFPYFTYALSFTFCSVMYAFMNIRESSARFELPLNNFDDPLFVLFNGTRFGLWESFIAVIQFIGCISVWGVIWVSPFEAEALKLPSGSLSEWLLACFAIQSLALIFLLYKSRLNYSSSREWLCDIPSSVFLTLAVTLILMTAAIYGVFYRRNSAFSRTLLGVQVMIFVLIDVSHLTNCRIPRLNSILQISQKRRQVKSAFIIRTSIPLCWNGCFASWFLIIIFRPLDSDMIAFSFLILQYVCVVLCNFIYLLYHRIPSFSVQRIKENEQGNLLVRSQTQESDLETHNGFDNNFLRRNQQISIPNYGSIMSENNT